MGGIHAEERAHAVKYELGSVLCRGSTGYSDLGGSNAHTRARAPVVLVVRGWFMGRGRGRDSRENGGILGRLVSIEDRD